MIAKRDSDQRGEATGRTSESRGRTGRCAEVYRTKATAVGCAWPRRVVRWSGHACYAVPIDCGLCTPPPSVDQPSVN